MRSAALGPFLGPARAPPCVKHRNASRPLSPQAAHPRTRTLRSSPTRAIGANPAANDRHLLVAHSAHGGRVGRVGEHQVEVVRALRHLDRDEARRGVGRREHAARAPRVVLAVGEDDVGGARRRKGGGCGDPAALAVHAILGGALGVDSRAVGGARPEHVAHAVDSEVRLLWQPLGAPLVVPDAVIVRVGGELEALECVARIVQHAGGGRHRAQQCGVGRRAAQAGKGRARRAHGPRRQLDARV
mmetsp:Transcript_65599/g.179927  ORF Transcript_65599/g.179927 Transcript_65599/m.179927 type:complete len:244 (-) Transcript_65599:126-857(-)